VRGRPATQRPRRQDRGGVDAAEQSLAGATSVKAATGRLPAEPAVSEQAAG